MLNNVFTFTEIFCFDIISSVSYVIILPTVERPEEYYYNL